MNSTLIMSLSQPLRQGIDHQWGGDDSMEPEYVLSLPPGRFVTNLHAHDPEVLGWLVYFVARRTLPCWELSCDVSRPRDIVDSLGRHLRDGEPIDWTDAETATPSPYDDCRFSDTQSASDAVADAAHYVHHKDPLSAIYCISSADLAYAHVLTEDQFRRWLIEIAVPAAFDKREMELHQLQALRQSVSWNFFPLKEKFEVF